MSKHFSNWLKLNSCGTTPRQRLSAEGSRSRSWPNTLTVPLVLFTRVERMPMVVDLPAPLGPSKAKKSPSATSRSMPFRA
ncbi:hypothetical protein D3C81_1722880 [compost metagenome]